MSLLGQLAQRSLGMFDGITLGTESGIAQTRRAWAALGAITETIAKTAITAAVAATLTRITAVAALVPLARSTRTLLLRAVITTHGHGRLVLQRRRSRRTHGALFQRGFWCRFGGRRLGCCGSICGLLFLLATDGIVQGLHG